MKAKERAILIIIFVISFLLRLYYAVHYDESIFLGSNDQLGYVEFAKSLLYHHAFNSADGRPSAYITPLYPLFLSVIYFFFGVNHLYARIVQALLGSLVCLIIYFIAKEVFSRSVARLAFFFMSIHYFFISYGGHLLSENLFIFLVSLSILFLIKFCKKPTHLYAVLFGLFSSLATLTRSVYFFFPFIVITMLFLRLNFINLPYKKLIKFSLIIVLCLIFPVSIWTVRNYLVFKSFVPLGTEAGIVLYSSYNPPKEKVFDSSPEDEVTLSHPELSEVETCQFLLKQTLVSIKKEPSKIYKYIPLKLMYFFSVFEWVAFKVSGAYNFSTGFILPLSFLGIILMFKKKYPQINFILLLPVIYFVLITIVIMGVPRTRLPVEPYLIILASFFVHHIYSQSHSKIRIVSIVSIWHLFNYLLYLNSLNVKIIARSIVEKIGLW